MAHFRVPGAPWKSDSVKRWGNKTARAKKSILISDVNDKAVHREVDTSAGRVVFEHGMAQLPADARGRDIVDEYKSRIALDPSGVAVAKDRPTRWRDPIHRNFWGGWPDMPWKREDAES